MKMITLLSVMTAATLATAQTNTATTNATTNTVAQSTAQTASTNVKKAVKKTVKKANKASAAKANTEQKGSATVTTETTSQAPQIDNSAANTANSAAAIAAGSSTTVVAATPAPTKKFGARILTEIESGMDAVNDNIAEANADIATQGSLSYKVNDKLTLGVSQTLASSYVKGGENTGKFLDTRISAATKVNGIMGSEAIAPKLSYYLPTNAMIAAYESDKTPDVKGFMGILRGDAEIKWVLNPSFSFGYYLNPRLTMFDQAQYDNKIESTFRLLQAANFYYTMNDIVTPYAYLSYDNRVGFNSGYSKSELANAAIGLYVSLGNFGIATEVISEQDPKKIGTEVSALSHETMKYYLMLSASY